MTRPTRRIWYVRIDDSPNYDHAANLRGLRAAALRWGRGLEVEDHWLGDTPTLTAQALLDKQVFALFFAGSFPEWSNFGVEPAWAQLLDHLARLAHETTVPALAVCGSHQAIARGYKDWSAVGHMVHAGQPPALISQELAHHPPQSNIPSPRLGEVGTFPYALSSAGANDPLFQHLSGKLLHFTESHFDEVELDHSAAFVPLLTSARDKPAVTVQPIAPEDRVDVVALRLVSDSRILYTMQFHPELPSHPSFTPEQAQQAAALGNDGDQLLRSFFDIAEAYWQAQGVTFASPSATDNIISSARRTEQAISTVFERVEQATSLAVERFEHALSPLIEPLQQTAERTVERVEERVDRLLARADHKKPSDQG